MYCHPIIDTAVRYLVDDIPNAIGHYGQCIYGTNMKIGIQIDEGQSYRLVKTRSLWDIPSKSYNSLLPIIGQLC